MTFICRRQSDGKVLAERVRVADTFWSRFRGLMLAPSLPLGEGLLIEPCTSIHMMFMRFAIDAVFLDAGNRVVALYSRLRPWLRVSGWHRNAVKVIELPAGTIEACSLCENDLLSLESAAAAA